MLGRNFNRQDISKEPLLNRVANLVPNVLKYLRTRLTDGTNELVINSDGSVKIPTGASTEAKQDDQITQETIIAGDTTSIDGKIVACDTTDKSTATLQGTSNGLLTTIDADTGAILVNQTDKSQMSQITDGTNEVDILQNADDDSTPEDLYGIVTSSVLYGRTSGSDIRPLRIDSSTNSIQTIDYAHHEIHSGSHYKAGYQDTNMATNDTITLLFVTPNTTEWAHWTLVAQATGAVKIEVYEDTVTSSNGTAVTRFNRNRNSANTSSTLAYRTPTVTSDGTKISTKWLGSEGFKEDTGGEARGTSELILKQNTKYLVRLTAISDGIVGAIGGDWYEHTDKN